MADLYTSQFGWGGGRDRGRARGSWGRPRGTAPHACKDIPDEPVLRFLLDGRDQTGWRVPGWATWFAGYDNSVQQAMPPHTPAKLARAKMAMLIRRGLVSGCTCGCRGDFEITSKGLAFLYAAIRSAQTDRSG